MDDTNYKDPSYSHHYSNDDKLVYFNKTCNRKYHSNVELTVEGTTYDVDLTVYGTELFDSASIAYGDEVTMDYYDAIWYPKDEQGNKLPPVEPNEEMEKALKDFVSKLNINDFETINYDETDVYKDDDIKKSEWDDYEEMFESVYRESFPDYNSFELHQRKSDKKVTIEINFKTAIDLIDYIEQLMQNEEDYKDTAERFPGIVEFYHKLRKEFM